MSYAKVSIIILNWNGLEDTAECLESLKKISYPNYEVIVVDNGSEGNDSQVLKEEFSDYIQLVQNDRNYGCGEGFNSGIRHVLQHPWPDYILIMNNDIVVSTNFLDELVRVAEGDKQIGILGPKIYYYDYKGRNDIIWSAGGKIRWWHPKIYRQIGGNADSPRYQLVSSVDWISGAVLMFKSCLVEKIGLLNTKYFFGHEDIEYCLKARRLGFRTVYVPNAKAWHKVGAFKKKVHITYVDPSSYYYFIKHNFPSLVYTYHLFLLPGFLLRWVVLYLTTSRNRYALIRFLSDFKRFILGIRKQSY